MTAKKTLKNAAQPLPAELAAVQLIDAKTAAAGGTMSVSWWHGQVSAGSAPQPVIRSPRCTRWKLSDVCAYWASRADSTEAQAGAAVVMANARKATDAATAARSANGKGSNPERQTGAEAAA